MELDKYQQAWKADAAQREVRINTELLEKVMQQSHRGFQSTINWRDFREVGVSVLLLVYWFYQGLTKSMLWTWWLMVPALIWVAGFILVDRWQHPKRPTEPGGTLLFSVKEALAQVEHQIWLLRNILWWYILPGCISVMAFFIHVSWETSSSWWDFAFYVGCWSVFTLVINGVIYVANQYAVRSDLEPRRADLVKLVAGLEDETGGNSDSVAELASAFADPARHGSFSTEGWVANWNRIVPSWRVATAIMIPTLAGTLCGLYSGLWIRIPEMGPVFFQAVIGAVIPFEIVFFTFMYLAARKKAAEQSAANSMDRILSATGVATGQSGDHKSKRLPAAPAFAILVLTLVVGLMAILAVFSFFLFYGAEDSGADSPFHANNSWQAPDRGDVSAFGDIDIARIDTWLQKQVEFAKYPSLSVAIVRDGKIAYGRSFGFEDIMSGRKATMQTQYSVASVTKVFTASLAVMLHQQGVVDLDQPVAKYLPSDVTISTTPETGATITLRQLASHTSGLPRGIPGRVQSVDDWYELEPQRLYDHLANVILESDPGTKELYSNLGFGLLGHALERAASKPLDRLVKEMICDPLKLERTAIQSDQTLHPATGYDDSGQQRERKASFRERLAGSGGLVASAEDLAKFLAAQMKPGVFSSEMLKELHTRTSLSSGTPADTALGWSFRFNEYLGPYPEKNGGRSNCSAWIGFAPAHGVGVVVVTNCGGPDVDQIGRSLLERSAPGAYQVPAAHKPVRKDGFARVAPFTGVRWENDRPVVCVQDDWSPLVSINGIPIDRIMVFASREFGSKARKRFSEDLVEVLSKMGHEPDLTVTLGLETASGRINEVRVLMTKANRDLVWTQGNPQ